MSSVAVVGLGGMGSRIARRLLDAGHEVVVWNRSPERAQPLAEAGAVVAESPADATRRADAVIVVVADPEALRAVTEGEEGIAAAAEGTTVIQTSTVSPRDIEWLDSRVPELLDAPVLGSLSEVESGSLKVFAGGPEELVDRWTPLLATLGSVVRVGGVGAGTAAKLVANSTLLGVLGVLGEALALGQRLGLAQATTFEVLSATPLAAQAERRRAAVEAEDFPLRFALRLALKDADLITASGEELKLAPAAREWFAEATQASWGDRDYSAILAWIRSKAADR